MGPPDFPADGTTRGGSRAGRVERPELRQGRLPMAARVCRREVVDGFPGADDDRSEGSAAPRRSRTAESDGSRAKRGWTARRCVATSTRRGRRASRPMPSSMTSKSTRSPDACRIASCRHRVSSESSSHDTERSWSNGWWSERVAPRLSRRGERSALAGEVGAVPGRTLAAGSPARKRRSEGSEPRSAA